MESISKITYEPERSPVFEVKYSWEELFKNHVPDKLEQWLPAFLKAQRWFGAKNKPIKKTTVTEVLPLKEKKNIHYILFVQVSFMDGSADAYVIPITCLSGDKAVTAAENQPCAVLARVHRQSGSTVDLPAPQSKAARQADGYLFDAVIHEPFCMDLFQKIARRASIKGRKGRMAASVDRPLKSFQKQDESAVNIKVIAAEQSNTSIIFGNRYILKLFRRLQNGINPDLEISRFLSRKRFTHLPPLAGALEYRAEKEEPKTIAILQEYVPNQGDAWKYTLNSLYSYFEYIIEDHFDDTFVPPPQHPLELARMEIPQKAIDRIGFYLTSARLMARRTAEMHVFLSAETESPRFAPEEFSKLYQRSLYQSMRSLARQVLPGLKKQVEYLPEQVQIDAARISDHQQEILDSFRALLDHRITGKRIRCHGDFHLGQILYTGKDFVIIDFEGEPSRPISERRIKRSPLRDIAGMIRSFHYAAHSALAEVLIRGLISNRHKKTMEQFADYWYSWVCAAFLKAYFENAQSGNFLPHSDNEIRLLLDAFLMEKAIYEIDYELNNRPDWLAIPLKGTERLLKQAGKLKGGKHDP
jgi:maltose alpha-D-glucosyltransferase/alpha-amylase